MSTVEFQTIIEDGPIVGYKEQKENYQCYKFKQIPYARPPLGNLRFLPPVPVTPWKEPLDCTKDAPLPLCLINDDIFGSEDCLYIEVCTKEIKPEKLLPVMFWIGSCGFTWYLDQLYDSSLLVEQDVIFVRCGFRLGPFGFLSTNDFTAPGNCGLKDIVMALKWIQKNIQHFGGDPNNVTIFGSSSGAAIVHLLMLSPLATGLFHKGIMQSASALNNWSLTKNPSQGALKLAKQLEIKETETYEIVEKLRLVPASDIMNVMKTINSSSKLNPSMLMDFTFKPCIEEEFEGQAAFLCKSPMTIIKSGKINRVPLIIGSNNIEGSVLQHFYEDFYNYQKFNEDASLLVPKSLVEDSKSRKDIGQQLQKFYLGDEEYFREDTEMQYLQLVSDYYFSYYVNLTVKLHSESVPGVPIYYYIMNQVGEWLVPKEFEYFNTKTGHFAELPFIFKLVTHDSNVCKGSRDSINTRNRVTKLWTNFAKYGNPTPHDNDSTLEITWDPVEGKEKLNYLSIGAELTKGRNPFKERMAFWDKLNHDYKFLRAILYFNDLGVTC